MSSQVNFLSPLNFVFRLSILPNTEYLVQQALIPGMQLGIAYTPSPFVKIANPGNIEYDELQITFKVGENMADYLEIFNWMVALGHPDSLSQFKNTKSDATMIIMDSAKNPNITINFTDCFPTSITPLEMDTTLDTIQYVKATASFKFQRFYYHIHS